MAKPRNSADQGQVPPCWRGTQGGLRVSLWACCGGYTWCQAWHWTTCKCSPLVPLQASRLIVTFDEHVISNNFKFGVIYQKLGQVCASRLSPPAALRLAPQTWVGRSTCQGTASQGPGAARALTGAGGAVGWAAQAL